MIPEKKNREVEQGFQHHALGKSNDPNRGVRILREKSQLYNNNQQTSKIIHIIYTHQREG